MNWTTDRGLWRSFSWIWNFLETERADCRERPHELTRNWAVEEEEEEEELLLLVVGSEELGESVIAAADDVNRKRFLYKRNEVSRGGYIRGHLFHFFVGTSKQR